MFQVGDDPGDLRYLARQIERHQADAWDAFERLSAHPSDQPTTAGGDAELIALIAEHRHLLQTAPRGMSDEKIGRFSDQVRAVRARIDDTRPTTLACVLAVLEWADDDPDSARRDDPDYWPAKAVEGLRVILGRTGGAG